ncbi:MAG: hypothetical protein QNK03_18820 [Myxococcota bacterium]|nr:hypothetical protein [Myxococcota bacterium]
MSGLASRRRWLALAAPMLCVLFACPPEGSDPNPPPADDPAGGTNGFVDSTTRDSTASEGAQTQQATDQSFDSVGQRTYTIPSGDVTFDHQSEFVEGTDSVAIELDGSPAQAVSGSSTTFHEIRVFNFQPTDGRVRVQVNIQEFGAGEGVTLEHRITLRGPSGQELALTAGEPVDLVIANNEPDGEDWQLEIELTATVEAGADASGAAITARYYVLGQVFGACDDDVDCDEGFVCGDDGFCECDGDEDCGPGQACQNGFCQFPFCDSSFDCERGELCNFSTCESAGAGQSCQDSSQCPRPFRCLTESFNFVCGQCDVQNPCPPGQDCVDLECVDEDSRPCLGDDSCNCSTRNDCDEGETCQRGVCTATGLCASDADCGEGFQCCTPQGYADVSLGQQRYCDRTCPQRCESDEECPTGSCAYGWCEHVACGDGFIDGKEQCDGANLGGADCASIGDVSGTLACAPETCRYDTSGCVEPVCGDGRAEGDEWCDGDDLRGQACGYGGFNGGTLACLGDCAGFDYSGCECDGASCAAGQICMGGVCLDAGTCGDGVADPGEQCDDADRDAGVCQAAGFVAGTSGCDFFCRDSLASCQCGDEGTCGPDELCVGGTCTPPGCGNGVLETGETCDGETVLSCPDGFNSAFTRCTGTCTPDTSRCLCGGVVCPAGQGCFNGMCGAGPQCGNGVVDPGEPCDGNALGGLGCADLAGGWTGGTPTCSAGCDRLLATSCLCDGVSCGENETCVGGRCACVPGASRCGPDDRVDDCGADGTYRPGHTCADGCRDGECVARPQQEPNNTVVTAQDLGSFGADTQVVVAGDFLAFGDEDVYTFTLDDPGLLTLTVSEPPAGGGSDVALWLYETSTIAPDEDFSDCAPEDGCLASDDDSGPGLFPELPVFVEAGEYLIRAAPVGPFPSDFELTITLQSPVCAPGEVSCNGSDAIDRCNEDGTGFEAFAACAAGCDAGTGECIAIAEMESNDTSGEAESVALDAPERVAVTGGQDDVGDRDWYAITFDDDVLLSGRITAGTVELLDAAETTLWDESADFDVILEPGTYFLEVTPFGGPDSYVLFVDAQPLACAPGATRCEQSDLVQCSDDGLGESDLVSCLAGCADGDPGCLENFETEPNDSIGAAFPMGLVKRDTEAAVVGNLASQADSDFYVFTLDQPAIAVIETSDPGFFDPADTEILLATPAGELINFDADAGDGFFSRLDAPLAAGDYIVEVRAGSAAGGNYRLAVQARSDGAREVVAGAKGLTFSLSDLVSEGSRDRRSASSSQLFALPAGSANTFETSAEAQAPDGTHDRPELSAAVTATQAEATTGVQGSGAARGAFAFRTSTTSGEATIPIEIDVELAADLFAPDPSFPGGGNANVQIFVRQVGDGVSTDLGRSGAQIDGVAFAPVGDPCARSFSLDSTDLSTASERRFTIDLSCGLAADVEANAEVVLELVLSASVTVFGGAAPPAPLTGGVTSSTVTMTVTAPGAADDIEAIRAP